MEFEEMQIIWDNQNNEKLYAIDEATLFKNIKRKGRSVNHLLTFVQVVMIGTNLFAGIALLLDSRNDESPWGKYLIAGVYLAYCVYAVIRWINRYQDEKQFEETMVGELDRAIWRTNYLIKQGKDLITWYLIPLIVLGTVFLIFEGSEFYWIGLIWLSLPLAYYGGRWEINKWYLPKKRDLESLRETLLSEPDR